MGYKRREGGGGGHQLASAGRELGGAQLQLTRLYQLCPAGVDEQSGGLHEGQVGSSHDTTGGIHLPGYKV